MTGPAQQQQQSAQIKQQDAANRAASQKQSSMLPMPTVHVPTHDEIAQRAYDIYSRRGRAKGQCHQNWHEAESDLRKQQLMAGGSDYRNTPMAHRDGTDPVGKNYDEVIPSANAGSLPNPGSKTPSSTTGSKYKL